MKKILFIVTLFFCYIIQGNSQDVVKGRVLNNGSPVPLVTVSEADLLGNATATDNDGNFEITVKTKSRKLIFTHALYLSKTLVPESNSITVELEEDIKGLEETVVVGFTKQKKVTLTGAVSSISGRELRQSPTSSIQNALMGRLPGFFSQQRSGQPGADGASFQIRGISSFAGGATTQPLILVDNIEYSYEYVSQLDANEIETVTILKDAASTAIYGIKGANGVLLITTRRGNLGKPVLTFTNETGFTKETTKPKYLGPYETLELTKKYYELNGVDPKPLWPQFFNNDAYLEYNNPNRDIYRFPYVDWYEELTKNSTLRSKINFDITGGTERVKYMTSLGYYYGDGLLKDFSKDQGYNSNYYYKRYNFRSNLDITPTDRLFIQMDLNGRFEEINNPTNDMLKGNASIFPVLWHNQTSPFAYPIYNPDGTYGARNGASDYLNFLAMLKYGGYEREYKNNFGLNSSVRYNIAKGLDAKIVLAYSSDYDFGRNLTRGTTDIPTFMWDPITNTYTPLTPDLYRLKPLTRSSSSGSTKRNLNLQYQLTYNKKIGKHNFGFLGLYALTSSSLKNPNNVAKYSYIPENTRGITGRVTYDFASKYLLEFNGAYNGTNRFAKGKKFGFFPAVSGGWVLSNEEWFKDNVDFIDLFKIRGSWGRVGSDKLGLGRDYAYDAIYNTGQTGSFFGENPVNFGGITEGQLANQGVTWETERKINVGLDLSIKRGLIALTAEYFDNYRYDILTTRQTVPTTAAITLPPVNLGEVSNKGFEIELKHQLPIGKNFIYRVSGQISVAKNKVLFQDEASQPFPYMQLTGQRIGSQLVYKWIGFYQDSADIANGPKASATLRPGYLKYADINNDGLINANDRSVLTYSDIPEVVYGFTIGFSYKSLDFTALFQGAKNVSFYMPAQVVLPFPGSRFQEYHRGIWTPENKANATFPLLGLSDTWNNPNNQLSDFWSVDASYLRFKNFELGYSFPAMKLSILNISSLRLFANGQNLHLWSGLNKKYFVDPETIRNSTGIYPQQKVYNFGVQVRF